MKKIIKLVFLHCFFSCCAQAAPINLDTGNELYASLLDLRSGSTSMQAVAAYGFVLGVSKTLYVTTDLKCTPPGVTQGQTIDIVFAYLQQHPEIRHKGAATLSSQALIDAFPCSDESPKNER